MLNIKKTLISVLLVLCLCFIPFIAVCAENAEETSPAEDTASEETSTGENTSSTASVEVSFEEYSKEESSYASNTQGEAQTASDEKTGSETASTYQSGTEYSSVKNSTSDKEETSSDVTASEPEQPKKNIFSLESLAKKIIFIPAIILIACIVALVFVNKKGWLEGIIEKKRKKNSKKR